MYINVKGELMSLSSPKVMGILNVTPDSFYSGSRKQSEKDIIRQISQFREEGADIIDVGGYSSRPGAIFVSEGDEMERLDVALKILLKEYPEAIISIDTFRSKIARYCAEKYGISIINDISGGALDKNMFQTIADLNIPYILMHMRGNPQNMTKLTHYDNFREEIFLYFAQKKDELTRLGVKDIILDPGFGFAKNIEQNYRLMAMLEDFRIFDLPILVGISRKKMIREVLDCSIEDSLNGTTVLNVYALLHGANIIRVHDVKAAVEAVKLLNRIKN